MEKVGVKLLEKISSYQFLNNLIPGALFCVLLPFLTRYDLMGENVWFNLVIVYFCGIVISRFGSIVIENILKWIHAVKFEPYHNYLEASEKDPFIKTLSMENNMYRTFISLFVLLFLAKLSDYIASKWAFWDENISWILCVLLLALCIGAYIKQTHFIVERIKKQIKSNEK